MFSSEHFAERLHPVSARSRGVLDQSIRVLSNRFCSNARSIRPSDQLHWKSANGKCSTRSSPQFFWEGSAWKFHLTAGRESVCFQSKVTFDKASAKCFRTLSVSDDIQRLIQYVSTLLLPAKNFFFCFLIPWPFWAFFICFLGKFSKLVIIQKMPLHRNFILKIKRSVLKPYSEISASTSKQMSLPSGNFKLKGAVCLWHVSLQIAPCTYWLYRALFDWWV